MIESPRSLECDDLFVHTLKGIVGQPQGNGSVLSVFSSFLPENIDRVFGLEGRSAVDGDYSVDSVVFIFGTPVDGKVKFAAGPREKDAGAFFMKVKMLQ